MPADIIKYYGSRVWETKWCKFHITLGYVAIIRYEDTEIVAVNSKEVAQTYEENKKFTNHEKTF